MLLFNCGITILDDRHSSQSAHGSPNMKKLYTTALVISLISACSSNSTSTSTTPELDKSDNSNSSSGGLASSLICDKTTAYPLNLDGHDTSIIGTELELTNFRYRSNTGSADGFIATDNPATMDLIRKSYGDFEQVPLAQSPPHTATLTYDSSSVSLQIIQPPGETRGYTLSCIDSDVNVSQCNSIKLDEAERTITFDNTELAPSDTTLATAPLTLSGALSWEVQDEVALNRPSCLEPASIAKMQGMWDATLDFGGGIINVQYYHFVSDTQLVTYDYRGDTAFQPAPIDCYQATPYTIVSEDNGVIAFFDEPSFFFIEPLFRISGKNRIFTLPGFTPSTQKPTTKTASDLTPLCSS